MELNSTISYFFNLDRIFDLADLMDAENSQRKTFLQNAIRYASASVATCSFFSLQRFRCHSCMLTFPFCQIVGRQITASTRTATLFFSTTLDYSSGRVNILSVFQRLALRAETKSLTL